MSFEEILDQTRVAGTSSPRLNASTSSVTRGASIESSCSVMTIAVSAERALLAARCLAASRTFPLATISICSASSIRSLDAWSLREASHASRVWWSFSRSTAAPMSALRSLTLRSSSPPHRTSRRLRSPLSLLARRGSCASPPSPCSGPADEDRLGVADDLARTLRAGVRLLGKSPHTNLGGLV